MKRDNSQTPARAKTARRRFDKRRQAVQLRIHRDPQSLKCSRGRMNLPEAWRAKDALYRPSQVQGGRKWARPHNRPRNLARPALLSIYIEDVCDLLFPVCVDDIRSRQWLLPVHAHVQRAFTHKGKPPVRIVEHHRGNADIRQNPIDIEKSVLFGSAENIPEVRFYKRYPIGEPLL